MKSLLLSVVTVLGLYSNHANAAFELEDAYFNIGSYEAVCSDCETWTRDEKHRTPHIYIATPNIDLDVRNYYYLTGDVVINERDLVSFSTRKTVIPGVKLRITATGLIADLSFSGNGRMKIMGLSGNKIKDLFDTPFHGGKIRAQFVLNLAGTVAANSNNIWIWDSEQLLVVGAALDVTKVRMLFSFDPNAHIKQTVVGQDVTETKEEEDPGVAVGTYLETIVP
ncbi:MAG: hypothetical protein JNL01_08300 [Bdellovibrionales bacterium]|nr:hypothetical protein [Bdellovibrionales bacterium]